MYCRTKFCLFKYRDTVLEYGEYTSLFGHVNLIKYLKTKFKQRQRLELIKKQNKSQWYF